MKLVQNLHLKLSQSLAPVLEIILNLLFELCLLISVLVRVLPIKLRLSQLNFRSTHLVDHLFELFRVFRYQSLHLSLLADIVAFMGPKEGTMGADTDLAA